MLVELHLIFHGLVQGVRFRATVAKQADRLQLTGWVRNLEDGSVEAYVQGPKEKLYLFLENIKKAPGFAKIESISQKSCEPREIFKGFRVVY